MLRNFAIVKLLDVVSVPVQERERETLLFVSTTCIFRTVWSGNAGTQQASSTDLSASDIAYYIALATNIFSILYWLVRGHQLARLFNVIINLDEEREMRNSFWGLLVSQIAYAAFYAFINVYSWGTIVNMTFLQNIYRFLISIINYQSTIGHALLFYWICSELASTLVHFREQVRLQFTSLLHTR